MTEYPVVIKASDGDTVLDGKNVSPIKLGRQKEQSLTQHSESINCKVTKGNRLQSGNVSKSHHLQRDLMILHQNIRGLNNTTDEMAITIVTNPPHVICFTEHHLKTYELDNNLFQNYKLGAKFCSNVHKNGGVCMYIHESCQFSNINVQNFCIGKDLEVCGIILTKLYYWRTKYIQIPIWKF
jgi:hypothetical protein